MGLRALRKALEKNPEQRAMVKQKLLHEIKTTTYMTYPKMKREGIAPSAEQMLGELDGNIKGMCRVSGITDEELLGVFKEAIEKAG